jgi:hypothetical protein
LVNAVCGTVSALAPRCADAARLSAQEEEDMSTIITKDGTEIYFNEWGSGQPVVFSHGWPLSAEAFEDQMFVLASHGYRCIAPYTGLRGWRRQGARV